MPVLDHPPQIDAELAALLRLLEFGEGVFSSSLAICNSPVERDRLIEVVAETHPGLRVVTVPARTVDVFRYVDEECDGVPDVLFLVGLESSISCPDADSHTLRSLNASRDLWPKRFPCPIVLWLPEYAATALSQQARDYWRFLSHHFYFASDTKDYVPPSHDHFAGRFLNVVSLSLDEKLARIVELVSRLTDTEIGTDPIVQQHRIIWWDELAIIHRFIGNWDEALRIYREEQLPFFERHGHLHSKAITLGQIAEILNQRGQSDEALHILEQIKTIFYALGDERSRAVTLGLVADILQLRGQADEALRIRREEQLPVFDRLGDVHAKAVTLSLIADILQQRGQFDEALRIRRDEVLPVYQRLGDMHAKTVATGKIADILRKNGQSNEALHIYRYEQLPIYERLGDVREKAVTMGKIADILQERGQSDEALRIYRDEVLPIYDRLGDVQAKSVTMGKIADITLERGDAYEAIRIYRDVDPILQQVGDIHSQIMCRRHLATALLTRGYPKDVPKARELLQWALTEAEKHNYAEAAQLRRIVQRLTISGKPSSACRGRTV